MKKILCVLAFWAIFSSGFYISYGAEIRFEKIDKTGGKPLMQALSERKTQRSFSNKPISNDILGRLLWAAGGVNRNNGKKTVPYARGNNDISIYILRNDGGWLYNSEKNLMTKISDDGIKEKGMIRLVFVSNSPKYVEEGYAQMHAGSMYQNAALFCASEGLANVVEGSFNENNLAAKLKLDKKRKIIITQKIGWAK